MGDSQSPPPPSWTMLLHDRSFGKLSSRVFQRRLRATTQRLVLSDSTFIASAHKLSIECLHVDRHENRFLLAGSRDATVSVYDMSKWGTEHYLRGKTWTDKRPAASVYPAIAKSVTRSNDAIVNAQWYPSDTGAFVTASAQGSISVWETAAMKPVASYNPLPTCYCMGVSPLLGRSQNTVAVGAKHGANTGVKLVDLHSGATSHSLVGQNSVTAIQWSPISDVVLASGSADGTIRLWDIRKSGSRSCLCVLDRDASWHPKLSRPCMAHYAHLIPRERSKRRSEPSPNNFRQNESNVVVSHGGAVTGLAFAEDGLTLFSSGTDGKLQVWELRGIGHLMPISFRYRGQSAPVSRMNQRVPMLVKNYGAEVIAWVGVGSRVLGYSLQRGGLPSQELEGHMLQVTALDTMDHSMKLVSAANDGMLLTWEPSKSDRPERRRRSKRPRDADRIDRDSW